MGVPSGGDGFSCLAIVTRVVTAIPFLSKNLCHQKMSQPVPDPPLQHLAPGAVSLCLHCLQEALVLAQAGRPEYSQS